MQEKTTYDAINSLSTDKALVLIQEKQYDVVLAQCNKAISQNKKDAEAWFFRRLSEAYINGLNVQTIEPVHRMYLHVCKNIPIRENWHRKRIQYSIALADILVLWFKKIHDYEWDTYKFSWYAKTVDDFYRIRDKYKACYSFFSDCIFHILESDISDYDKENKYAFYFAWALENYSLGTLYYKINDHDLAIKSSKYCGPIGVPLDEKKEAIELFDSLCFEVRKFSPNFKVTGVIDEYGSDIYEYGFDRLDPPTTYQNQQTRNSQTRMLQMQKDREIKERIEKWRISGGESESRKIQLFWIHMDNDVIERTKYQELLGEQEKNEAYEARMGELMFLNKIYISSYKHRIDEYMSTATKLKNKLDKKNNSKNGKMIQIESTYNELITDLKHDKEALAELELNEKRYKKTMDVIKKKVEESRTRVSEYMASALI